MKMMIPCKPTPQVPGIVLIDREQHRNKNPECLFFTAQAVVKVSPNPDFRKKDMRDEIADDKGKKRAPRKTKQ
jgi:hypothetical protein